jgi:hypothetical protein
MSRPGARHNRHNRHSRQELVPGAWTGLPAAEQASVGGKDCQEVAGLVIRRGSGDVSLRNDADE